MKEPILYLYGTFHGGKKSKNDLMKIFNIYKFDAVLSEGVEHQNQKIFQKEPFLIFPIWIYFQLLKEKGSEFDLANELAKKSNIDFKLMDKSLNELIEYFHKPYNNIVIIIIIIITGILLIFHNSIMFLLIVLFVIELIYSLYFVFKVNNMREEFFYENIKKTILDKQYKSVLVICGKGHRDFIKKKFDCNDLTDSI